MKLHRYEHIDNKKFYNEMLSRTDSSVVTKYMGECFINIGVGLSHRKNFQRYTYRDEMILDGIENCVRYVKNFDAKKYTNPHAYFTQIVWFAFLRRIAKEKKQDYIRNKIKMDLNLPDLDWEEVQDLVTSVVEDEKKRYFNENK